MCVTQGGKYKASIGNIQKIPEEFFNLPYPTSCPACCHSILKSICVGRRVSFSRSHLCYWPSCAFGAPWGDVSLRPYFLGGTDATLCTQGSLGRPRKPRDDLQPKDTERQPAQSWVQEHELRTQRFTKIILVVTGAILHKDCYRHGPLAVTCPFALHYGGSKGYCSPPSPPPALHFGKRWL